GAATTGVPQAIASTTGNPKPSYLDGNTRQAARWYSRTSSSLGTYPRTSAPRRVSSAASSSSLRGPTTTSLRPTAFAASTAARGSLRGSIALTNRRKESCSCAGRKAGSGASGVTTI